MYCPKCGAEYRPGFSRCADCDVYLVDQPEDAQPRPDPHREMVEVFKTSDSILLPVVKSLLDSAGIDYVTQGEEALGVLPLGPAGSKVVRASWAWGATLYVAEEDAASVKELLAQLEDDFEGAGIPDEGLPEEEPPRS
jgi:hypothetical protein